MADIVIKSLRGGLNETDPPSTLAKDQCTVVSNVEFNDSACGERRRGTLAIDVTGSNIESHTTVSFLYNHSPSMNTAQAELWALSITSDTVYELCRKTSSWSNITLADSITANIFKFDAQSLHQKLYLAYQSAVDRLHVWDGTSVRRVGLAEPAAAPTGANTGVGTLAGTRYYRVRFTKQSGGTTLLRSEPSDVLTFVPSGSGTGVVVTRPTAINEGETHWELEASLDNANFYVIATTIIATTTATDSTSFSSGYVTAGFELSEDIGDYTVPYSARFVSADQDRLIIGASWADENLASRVSWSPVKSDPGVGNDERIPIDSDNFLDLDTAEGGGLTALSNTVNGYIYAFKISHIYQLVRTGLRARAYDAFALSKTRGAIEGSLVEGLDKSGRPCIYFLDPKVGPCVIGFNGLQTASRDIVNLWNTVNVNATIVARGYYYPEARQVHWFIATDGAEYPNTHISLQVNETRDTDEGLRRGWSTHTVPAGTNVTASCLFAENIDANTTRSLALKPIIGVGNGTSTDLILICDTGTTDNGVAYSASLVSAPQSNNNILNNMGIMNGAVMAKAATAEVEISVIKDFGVEESTPIEVDLAAAGSETQVIKPLDSLRMSEARTIQVKISDVDAPTGRWEINQIALKERTEQNS